MKNVSIKAKLLQYRNALLGITAFVSMFTFSSIAPAALAVDDPFGTQPVHDNINISTTNDDARVVVVRIINLALTFLGLIAVVLILWGGFKWMTAGGNDENVDAAKKIIIAAVIGLAIIISAYAIANFFINSIQTAVGDGTTP